MAKEKERGYSEAANEAYIQFNTYQVVPQPVYHQHLSEPFEKLQFLEVRKNDKGVSNLGLNQDAQGNLMIPGYDLSIPLFYHDGSEDTSPTSPDQIYSYRKLQTIQLINPDGEKKFAPGTKTKGAAFLIGENNFKEIALEHWQDEPKNAELFPLFNCVEKQSEILLAEDYATGATLHQATGLPVVVAFTVGNLKPVAEAIKNQFPKAQIVICADNDHHHKINMGLEQAMKAASVVDGRVVIPVFTDEEKQRGLTNFNDLAQSRGLLSVTKLINSSNKEKMLLDIPKTNKPVELAL